MANIALAFYVVCFVVLSVWSYLLVQICECNFNNDLHSKFSYSILDNSLYTNYFISLTLIWSFHSSCRLLLMIDWCLIDCFPGIWYTLLLTLRKMLIRPRFLNY